MTAPLLSLPAPLRPGDRVQLVAASSAVETPERLQAGLAVLASWGLHGEQDGSALARRHWGYLAGSDQQRLQDLVPAIGADGGDGEEPALLACVRGGWGAARLLEHRPRAVGRWLLGFSDVTSLLFDRVRQGRSGAIHGPMLTTLAAEPDWSRERLRALLFGEPVAPLAGEAWRGGTAQGPLLVANLTVATHLLGTPHLPDLQGAILVLEDVGEAPYRLERMLTHWRLCGALQQLAGIGFGQFSACEDSACDDSACEDSDRDGSEADDSSLAAPGDGSSAVRRFSVEQVLRERTADLGIPVLGQLPVGHVSGNAALPLGVAARLDGDRGRLSLLA
ncbi:MAG: LD-carboxypeptidase [Cyanobium sp.]